MRMSNVIRILLASAVFAVVGCGGGGAKTHTVSGRIEMSNGEIGKLAGSSIEAALESDPTVRGFGEIQPDGRFRLETLVEGQRRRGVPEGNYRVRILPNDDDPQARQQAVRAVAPRYLKFETSDLALEVPGSGEVLLKVFGP